MQVSDLYEKEKEKRAHAVTRLSRLQEEFEASNAELEQLRRAREESVSSMVTAKRSQKHPDPPLFTDGVDPTWEDWKSKMTIKLKVNKDYWDHIALYCQVGIVRQFSIANMTMESVSINSVPVSHRLNPRGNVFRASIRGFESTFCLDVGDSTWALYLL